MTESDDPVTLAVVGSAVVGTVAATGGFGGGPSGGGGRVAAGQATQTATPEPQRSEQAKRNRRLAASVLTRDFGEPTLSQPALLG